MKRRVRRHKILRQDSGWSWKNVMFVTKNLNLVFSSDTCAHIPASVHICVTSARLDVHRLEISTNTEQLFTGRCPTRRESVSFSTNVISVKNGSTTRHIWNATNWHTLIKLWNITHAQFVRRSSGSTAVYNDTCSSIKRDWRFAVGFVTGDFTTLRG